MKTAKKTKWSPPSPPILLSTADTPYYLQGKTYPNPNEDLCTGLIGLVGCAPS